MQVSNPASEGRVVHTRLLWMLGIVVLMTLVLFGRLIFLQVSQHNEYLKIAKSNLLDRIPLPPVRGFIYDRNGVVLAQNFQVFNLEILPDKVADMPSLLDELAQLVTLTEDDLQLFHNTLRDHPRYARQVLKENLNERETSRLAVNLHRLAGVQLNARLQRRYPQGPLTTHVVGYVGRIDKDDLEKVNPQDYKGLQYIGRSGVEAYYESTLVGKPGYELVETNAHGRVVRGLQRVMPEAGQNLHLSVDIHLQRRAMQLLEGYEGAVVVLQPRSGEVLAFASAPTYDPNPFVNGISHQAFGALRDSEHRPLINRALSGQYAPGSTIKSFMALVGMQQGISPQTTVTCPGWYSLPGHTHRYRDWKKDGHGKVDGHAAIVQSCDVYFYHLARQLGIEKIHAGMSNFGFGQASGIDLPNQETATGLVPSKEWKRRIKSTAWFPGETVITGIGQGYMLVTPLQLAIATATLANRGQPVTPRFLRQVETPLGQTFSPRPAPPPAWHPPHTRPAYAHVLDAMHAVVHGERGTARRIAQGIRYQMAGKTGTAQVKSIAQDESYDATTVEKKFRDHSLFIGFAPLDDPRIAIAVVVEHAGSGSGTAAPIARQLIDYYLLERLSQSATDATNDATKKIATRP